MPVPRCCKKRCVASDDSGEMEKSKLKTSSGDLWSRTGELGGGQTVFLRGIGMGLVGFDAIFRGVGESGLLLQGWGHDEYALMISAIGPCTCGDIKEPQVVGGAHVE